MKKSVCLMAVLGAFAASGAIAASTQSVEITFQGHLTEKTCDISLNNGSTQVNLGSMSIDEANGSKGQLVPITFKLSNCDNLKLDDKQQNGPIDLAEDLTNQNIVNSNAGAGTLATNMTDIVVQFYEDDQGTEGFKTKQKVENNKDGNVYFVNAGYVAMKKIADAKSTPGPVKARALFTVSYQ